jgi:hypothetical protein
MSDSSTFYLRRESMQRNMSWAGYERALPPEMIPHRLFDRLFGAQHSGCGAGGRFDAGEVAASGR